VPINEIDFSSGLSSFKVYFLAENNENHLTYRYSTSFVLQRKPVDEPVDFSDSNLKVCIRIHNQSLKSPLQYIIGLQDRKFDLNTNIFTSISRKLWFPENISFLVFKRISGNRTLKFVL
jgi:hypothetical protein